jgi:Spy/CpxP family protein refolding chaperone
MKKAAAVLFFVVLSFALALGADAQMCGQMGGMGPSMAAGGCGCGMMPGGMGAGMMGGRVGAGMMGRGMIGGGMMPEMMEHRGMMHMCMQHLGLSDKQKEEISSIRTAAMKEVIRKRADMQIARLELGDLLSREPVDMKAVEAKLKQIEGLRTGIHLTLITLREEIKSKLTPDQLKKMKDMMGKHPMMGSMDEDKGMQSPMGPKDGPQPEMEHMDDMD